jgi:predicted AlkP superfamily pyrophosphatase or phosphodiesterase
MAAAATLYSVTVPARPEPVSVGERMAARLLVVSIDGLRPDVMLRAEAPILRSLMARGSFTLWATTTAAAVTLPSHVSMLTGVMPNRHGIEWNKDLPLAETVYPAFPTLFDLSHRAGYTTAVAAGKSKMSALLVPGTIDRSFMPHDGSIGDAAVTDSAVAWIRGPAPDVLFVHLAGVDLAGHAYGWGSRAQLAAVAHADSCLGLLLGALSEREMLDATAILVSSDHGGAGRTHGPDDPRSRYIPWILAGPGIREDFDLTGLPQLDVRTEDTFATLCRLLAIPPGENLDGRVVTAALQPTATSAQ